LNPFEEKYMPKFQSGNPGGPGRPQGLRNRLQRDFLDALQKDFKEHGAQAIVDCRTEDPVQYLRVIASVLPKEFLFENVMGDMDDEQLDDLIAALRQRVLENRQAVALPAPERATNGRDCA
jgi:hypothetical protein